VGVRVDGGAAMSEEEIEAWVAALRAEERRMKKSSEHIVSPQAMRAYQRELARIGKARKA
jgi:ribosomal protein L29